MNEAIEVFACADYRRLTDEDTLDELEDTGVEPQAYALGVLLRAIELLRSEAYGTRYVCREFKSWRRKSREDVWVGCVLTLFACGNNFSWSEDGEDLKLREEARFLHSVAPRGRAHQGCTGDTGGRLTIAHWALENIQGSLQFTNS